eukprot:230065_1
MFTLLSPAISTRILFGSCNKPYLPQPLWSPILKLNADIWIWTGDAVYHDRPHISCFDAIYNYLLHNNTTTLHCHHLGIGTINSSIYETNFNQQLSVNQYQQLLTNNKTKIIGTWDDHDYGKNDGDYKHPYKYEAKRQFLKFLNVSMKNPIHNHDGMYSYHSYTFHNNLVIDIYLFDNRFFSNPYQHILLGDEQWNWLVNRLLLSTSNISIFVSGTQILPYYRGYYSECWSSVSKPDRQKLIELILKYNIKNAVLISGDVHYGEIMKYECFNYNRNDDETVRLLYEITSSGLTHSWSNNYLWIFNVINNISHLYLSEDGATLGIINDLNFGEIEIISNNNQITNLYLRVHGQYGNKLEIDLMDKKQAIIDANIDKQNVRNWHKNNIINDDWICIGYNQPSKWKSMLYIRFMFIIYEIMFNLKVIVFSVIAMVVVAAVFYRGRFIG